MQACPEIRLPRPCFSLPHGQAIRFLIAGDLATLVHWSVMAILVHQDMSRVRASRQPHIQATASRSSLRPYGYFLSLDFERQCWQTPLIDRV